MYTLAFDTSFAACSVAVAHGNASTGSVEIIASRRELMEQGHAAQLMPMIDAVMSDANVRFDSLDRLAVTYGPGTFTGTRIAIAAARGLALATGLPVYGTTSLHVMARQAVDESADGTCSGDIAVAVDARRGQVYFQIIRDDCAVAQPIVASPHEAATNLNEKTSYIIGSAARDVAANAAAHIKCAIKYPDLLPDARYLAMGDLEHLDPPRPLYLRPADAKPQTNKSIARVSS